MNKIKEIDLHELTKLPIIRLLMINLVVILFEIIPFYNWWYQTIIGFLGGLIFIISIPAYLFLTIRYIIYKKYLYSLMGFVLVFIVFSVSLLTISWRNSLTEFILNSHHCQNFRYLKKDTVLGGLRVIHQSKGTFENTSHCLISPGCKEEFFHCKR